MPAAASPAPLDPDRLRERLARAHLMLIFTPALGDEEGLLAVLETLAPRVDVIQVRPKPLGESSAAVPTSAAEARDLCRAVLERTGRGEGAPLVLVNDRVDVARLLGAEGLAGVHLGRGDTPPGVAREFLGDGPLVGLSTHTLDQVALAEEEPVDYLGFGPIHASPTKGYGRGLGPELAWVASEAAAVPVFPIGGIDGTNVDGLARVGRAAVGAAVLSVPDPAWAAELLRERLID